ncbi:MAG: aldo/keto reductase [Thermofilaceae archaeon]|nr:aldo/keto reductase [Thermofilaceae archaeon]MDW8004007.1 aldo/keto reductase [Thermofilaceae archaeon]
MEKRVLGRTGYKVTFLTVGGAGPGFTPDVEEGVRAFEMALEKGLNMVDIAPSYGEAEDRLGALISKHRDQIVLAEKTMERTREGAWRELKQSLSKLGVESFDVYQFHAVSSLEELDKIFGKDGALEAFLEARDTGLIKYIGITVHNDMRLVLKALERFDFDTVLIPVSAASMVAPAPENDFRPVLKAAVDRDIGVIAIKAIAKSRWLEERKMIGDRPCTTWYEPFMEQEDIDLAVLYTLSQDGVTTYSMAAEVRLWPKIIGAGERFRRMDGEEQARVIEFFKSKGAKPLFP